MLTIPLSATTVIIPKVDVRLELKFDIVSDSDILSWLSLRLSI